MHLLRKWLRIERAAVTLHPAKTIELEQPVGIVFDRCLRTIEYDLGGVVAEADRQSGRIEATFGLMFSERLTCTLDALESGRTRAVLESRRGPRLEFNPRSDYVDRLARELTGSPK